MVDGQRQNQVTAGQLLNPPRDYLERETERDRQARLQGTLDALGREVVGMAHQAVNDKRIVEERWIDDIRQFQGADQPVDRPQHNVTRIKTRTAAARIADLLFPSGADRNFSISPETATLQGANFQDAEKKAHILEDRIDDILDSSQYPSVGRSAIEYACLLGVGVVKGPVKGFKRIREWRQVQDEAGNVFNQSVESQVLTSQIEWVSSWDYFPDMSVSEQDECAYEFQRHYLSRIEIQEMLGRPDFNQSALIKMLETDARADVPWHVSRLRADGQAVAKLDRYLVWEGYLDLPGEIVKQLCDMLQADWMLGSGADLGLSDDEHRIYADIRVTAWVSDDGQLLKVALPPTKSAGRPFSIFCYDRDSSQFMMSPGVPRLMRASALAINAEWRRANDNSDLVVGPQYIVDPEIVEPIPDPVTNEQDWGMASNKGWRLKRPGADARQAFQIFNIPNQIQTSLVLMDKARQFADEEAMIPQIAQGEQSAQMTKTFQGMELLMNSANTVLRRVIKDWDDHVTIPLVERLVEDVMELFPIPGVDGAFQVVARGSNSLMLKETQSRNAVTLAQLASKIPPFAKKANWDALFDTVVAGLQVDPDKVILSDEEIAKREQLAQQQGQKQSPEEIKAQLEAQKMQLDMQIAQLETQVKQQQVTLEQQKLQVTKYVADLKAQVEMAKLQKTQELKAAEIGAKRETEKEKIILGAKAKEHLMAKELEVERTGEAKI